MKQFRWIRAGFCVLLCACSSVEKSNSVKELKPSKHEGVFSSQACKVSGNTDKSFSAVSADPSHDLTKALQSYREDWKTLCSASEKTSSLAALLLHADELALHLNDLMESAQDSKSIVRSIENLPALRIDDSDDMLRVEADLAEFARHSSLGDDADRLFFAHYYPIAGKSDLPSWYGKTRQQGDCVRFGEIDWASTLRKLDQGQHELKAKAYTHRLKLWSKLLGETFEDELRRAQLKGDGAVLCTCGSPRWVRMDLVRLRDAFSMRAQDARTSAAIHRLIQSIDDGRLKVRSAQERGC